MLIVDGLDVERHLLGLLDEKGPTVCFEVNEYFKRDPYYAIDRINLDRRFFPLLTAEGKEILPIWRYHGCHCGSGI
jgi:hypothetical protein